MARGTWLRLSSAFLLTAWLALAAVLAEEAAAPPPEPHALVGLARADHLYLPGPVYAPTGVYPFGKLDWDVVESLVTDAAAAAGFPLPWPGFNATDRVALMLDTTPPAVPLVTVDAILEHLIESGIAPDHIFLFSSTETDLFQAGFSLRSEGNGVRCYGADAMGYRGGTSRLVLDMCDKIISVSVLGPDPRAGLAGALFNYLNAVDPTTRLAILKQPDTLGILGRNRQLAPRVVLNFLDCTHPAYQTGEAATAAASRWEYRGMICSRDPVAADVLGREILEAKRAQVKGAPWPLEPAPTYLRVATDKYRFGISDRRKIDLVAVGDRQDFLLPTPPP